MYKSNFTPRKGLLLLLMLGLSVSVFAQKNTKHNDVVALSKNADENVSLLNAYANAFIAGKTDEANNFLAADYIEYGPGPDDTANLQQVLDRWRVAAAQRTDESIKDWRTLSVREKSGLQEGDWVMGWGVYQWTERSDGTVINLPFQVTARVGDGKLREAKMYYDRALVHEKKNYTVVPPGVDPDAYMIRQVLEAETQAWLDNDGEKMGSYWADLPYAAHTVTDEEGKAYDITATEIGEMVKRLSTQRPNKPGTTFVNSNYNIRPNGDAAWASFEQTYHYPDGAQSVTNLESRYLEKIDGQWKISHMVSIPKKK